MLNGIHEFIEFNEQWLTGLRVPAPFSIYVLVVLIVPFLSARRVRPFLL